MSEHDHRRVASADAAFSRGTALVVTAVVVLLMAVAALGWSHYRGADAGDPRVEILPTTPTSADGAETGTP